MATPMRSTDFRAVVEPILNEVFDGVYQQRDDEWKGFVTQITGIPRNYHEEVMLFGMNTAPEMPDGTPVSYDQGGTLYITRFIYKIYGLAYALTKVLMEDGDHIRIGSTFSKHLAQSMIETKETLCANLLNFAFTPGYVGGDGVTLIANNHPISQGRTYSNKLSTDAAMSQTSVEQLLIQIRSAVDNNGKRIRLKAEQLVVPPALEFQAEVILKSVLRSGGADNDLNPIKSTGMLPNGAHVVTRLSSSKAWFVQTNAENGLMLVMRRPLERSTEGDFETDSMRYKATERYATGWHDARNMYGTIGL
ncbi:Bacteriophage Mu, GpT [uncultured Caudovirales phage]|uniref:Bacteriophage Mu, GpT n=1 Tax=uncultured Caudovirales phage TaxID=2100421 RepID=A0A6J7WRB5_9CAUD|nr:Bacteriophage Mu, GpT [uncultured Caudovirales phage]